MDVKKHVTDYLKKKFEKRPREQGVYYVSEIPYCLRKNYYHYKIERPVPERVLGIFEAGIKAHYFLREVFRDSDVEFKEFKGEMPIRLLDSDDFSWRLHGRLDYFFILEENSEKIVIEAKSIKSLHYLSKPQKHHVDQLMLYLAMTGVKKGYVVYVDRNNYRNIKQFEVAYDKQRCKGLIYRVKVLHNHVKNSTLPFAERWKSWECEWRTKEGEVVRCPYFNECVKNYNSRKEDGN